MIMIQLLHYDVFFSITPILNLFFSDPQSREPDKTVHVCEQAHGITLVPRSSVLSPQHLPYKSALAATQARSAAPWPVRWRTRWARMCREWDYVVAVIIIIIMIIVVSEFTYRCIYIYIYIYIYSGPLPHLVRLTVRKNCVGCGSYGRHVGRQFDGQVHHFTT